MPSASIFRKRIAVPQEHGSWVFLLMPLLVGLAVGGRVGVESVYLLVAALAVFFMRQPLLAITKVRSGRRPRSDLRAAWTWLLLYAAIACLHVYGLALRGHADIVWLGVPAALIAVWHAWLVFHRSERRQELMEMLAAGALALSAPAAVIVAEPHTPTPDFLEATGFGLVPLWMTMWIASASMIACTYLRLAQRTWTEVPSATERLQAGWSALTLPILGLAAAAPLWPWLVPFALLFVEAVLATLRPGIGVRPRTIGIRQLVVSILVTAAFLLPFGR